jgi:hypothetical protein
MEENFNPIDERTKNLFQETSKETQGSSQSDLVSLAQQLRSENAQKQMESGITGDTQVTTAGSPSREFIEAQEKGFSETPYYERYGGSAWGDFYDSVVNAGIIRTAQGIADIPAYVSALAMKDMGQPVSGSWVEGWMQGTKDWADRNEGFVSAIGNKSFFETGDIRSLSAGLGQGIGSMIPMVAAMAATAATGGAAAPLMTGVSTGTLASVSATAINMMPSLVDEGLENGLSHEQSISLGMTLAPIIGMMEKLGLEAVIQAGLKPVTGKVSKEVFKRSFQNLAKKGVTKENFKDSVKVAMGEIAENYQKELIAKGVSGATRKAIGKEIGLRTRDVASKFAEGAIAEAGMESLQSLVETAGKAMFDKYGASYGAEAGKGKFGVDFFSKETFMNALEEGFYGGLIGGTFSTGARLSQGMKRETIYSALDSAKKRGKLDEEYVKMKESINNLATRNQNNPESEKELGDLNRILDKTKQMVDVMPVEISSPDARHQIFQLSNMYESLVEEEKTLDVEGTLPAMVDIVKARRNKLEKRKASVKQAINDIYNRRQAVDLQEKDIKGNRKYFIEQIEEELPATMPPVDDYTDVPSLTEEETSLLKTELDDVATYTQDEDMSYVNDSAEQVHKDFYGEEASSRLRGIVDDLSMDEDLYEDGFNVRKDLNKKQRDGLIDKLVTARRSVVEMMEQTDDEAVQTQLKNFDNLLRSKIQEAKALDVIEDKQLDGVKAIEGQKQLDSKQKRIGDEQVKSTIKPSLDDTRTKKDTQATEGTTEPTTEGTTEGRTTKKDIQKVDKKDSSPQPTPATTDSLKTAKSKGKAETLTNDEILAYARDAKARDFKSARHVDNAYNKYINPNPAAVNVTNKEQIDELNKFYAETTAEERAEIAEENKAQKENTLRLKKEAEEKAKISEEEKLKKEIEEADKKAREAAKKQQEEVESKDDDDDLDDKTELENFDFISDESIDDTDAQAFADWNSKKSKFQSSIKLIKDNPIEFQAMLDEVKKIFPNVDIKVLEKVFGMGGIELVGRVYDNIIELSEDKAGQEALFHELAHKFSPLLSGTKLWNKGLDLIKDTKYFETAKELYPDETIEEQAEEALVQLIAEKSLDTIKTRMGDSTFKKIQAWLKQFWNKIKYLLGKADADTIAEIAAFDLTMRTKPYKGSGLQFAEKATKYDQKTAGAIQSIINLAGNAKLYADIKGANPSAIFRISIERFKEEAYPDLSIKEFKNKFARHILKAKKELLSDVVTTEQELLSEMMPEIDEYRNGSFLDGGADLDKKIREVLGTAYDSSFNKVSEDAIYGVAIQAAKISRDPDKFLESLDTFASNSTSAIDKATAEVLSSKLASLPITVRKPIIAGLTSLVNVEFAKLYTDKKGSRTIKLSNARFEPAEISKALLDLIKANALTNIESKTFKDAFLGLGKSIQTLNKEKNYKNAAIQIDKAVQHIRTLTGVPFETSWFLPPMEEKKLTEQEKTDILISNLSKFNDAFARPVYKYRNLVSQTATTERSKAFIARKSNQVFNSNSAYDLNIIVRGMSEKIADSYGAKTVFRNAMNNQQSSQRVGGWFHKVLSSVGLVKGLNLSKREDLKAFGDSYVKLFEDNIEAASKKGESTFWQLDGIHDINTNERLDYQRMSLEQKKDFQIRVMLQSAKEAKGGFVYKNSMGVISTNDYKMFVDVPFLDLDKAKEIYNKLERTHDNLLPSDKGDSNPIHADKKRIREVIGEDYGNMLRKFNETGKKAHIYDYIKAYGGLIGQEVQQKDYRGTEEEVLLGIASEINNQLREQAETLAYNNAVNQVFLKSVTLGNVSDGTYIKDGKDNTLADSEKRAKGYLSPSLNIDLRIKNRTDLKNKKGEPRKTGLTKTPKAKIVVLKDILTQQGNEATDAASYFNDFIVNAINQMGGDLINYGLNYKPLINQTNSKGERLYMKTASRGFDINVNSTPQEVDAYIEKYHTLKGEMDRHGMIAKVMHEMSKANPDTPIIFAFESSMKGNTPYTALDIDSIYNDGNINLDSVEFIEEELTGFGIQFNKYKEVNQYEGLDENNEPKYGRKTTTAAAPIQLIASLMENPPQGLEKQAKAFQDLLAQATDFKLQRALKRVDNKKALLQEAVKSSKGMSQWAKDALEQFISGEEVPKLVHQDLINSLQGYLASVFNDSIRHRFSGAELTQDTDPSNQLKYHTTVTDQGTVNFAEVKVPEGFANIGEELITVRIPMSNKINVMVTKVVGFTDPKSSVMLVPEGWIDASNADNDGDAKFTWRKSKGSGALDVIYNKMFRAAKDLLLHPSMIEEGKGYKQQLDTKKVLKSSNEANKELGTKEQKISSVGIIGENQKSHAFQDSSVSIGLYAVIGKTLNVLSGLNSKFLNPLVLPTAAPRVTGIKLRTKRDTKLQAGAAKISTDKQFEIASILQLALDDAGSDTNFYETGLTKENAGASAMFLTVGYELKDVLKLVKSPVIKDYLKQKKEGKGVEYTNELKAKTSDQGRKDFELLESYQNAEIAFRAFSHIQNIVGLDSGVPYGVGAVGKINESIRKVQEEKFDIQFEQNILENPVIASRVNVLNQFNATQNDLFSTKELSAKEQRIASDLINSIQNKTSDAEVTRAMQRTFSNYIARSSSKYSYDKASLNELIEYVYDRVLLGKTKGQKFFNYIQRETQRDKDGNITDITAIQAVATSVLPELNIKENTNVDQEAIKEMFNEISESDRKALIEFAKVFEGLSNGSHNITTLLPIDVLEDFQSKTEELVANDVSMFSDQVVLNFLFDNVSALKEYTGKGIDLDTIEDKDVDDMPRYFKVKNKLGEIEIFERQIGEKGQFTDKALRLGKVESVNINGKAVNVYNTYGQQAKAKFRKPENKSTVTNVESNKQASQATKITKTVPKLSRKIRVRNAIAKLSPNQRVIMTSEKDFRNVSFPEQGASYKPKGTWYGLGDSWSEWVQGNMPQWETDYAHVLEIDSSRILKIKNYNELLEFTEKYGIDDVFGSTFEGKPVKDKIDWAKVKEDYAGIEIAPYIAEGRLNPLTSWYYTWDVASGAIWDSSAVKSSREILGDSETDTTTDDKLYQVAGEAKTERVNRATKRLLRRLSNKFGVQFTFVNDPDAKFTGYYDSANNVVVINEAKVRPDTAFHEFAHPFIASIKQSNPSLYASLVNEINATEEGKAVLDKVAKEQPNLNKEQQVEEAIVQMLGELATEKAGKLPTGLRAALQNLWDTIKQIVSELFGTKKEVIAEKLSNDTSLSQLADMLVDDTKVVIDKQNNSKAKSILNKLANSTEMTRKMFNETVEVVKQSDYMSNDLKQTSSKLTKAGFLSHDGYVVKQKSDTVPTAEVLSVSIPMDMANWMAKIRQEFPDAEIVGKHDSRVDNYAMYEVNAQGETIFVYKPLTPEAASLDTLVNLNLKYQIDVDTSTVKNPNTDDNFFSGEAIDLDKFATKDVNKPSGQQRLIALKQALYKDLTEKYKGILDDDAIKRELVREVIKKAKDIYNSATREGYLKGDLSGVVDSKYIDLLEEDINLAVYIFNNMDKDISEATYDPRYTVAYENLLKMMALAEHIENTKDVITSDNKGVNTSSVVSDIMDSAFKTRNTRAEFFSKIPVLGSIYKYISQKAKKVKKVFYDSLTPENFSKFITGKKASMLNALVYKQINEAEGNAQIITEGAWDAFRKKVGEEKLQEMKKYSSFLNDEGRVKMLTLEGGGEITYAQAMNIYLSLKQEDIRSKVSKTGLKINYLDSKTEQKKSTTISPDKFMAQMENAIKKNPDLVILEEGTRAMLDYLYGEVNKTSNKTLGVDINNMPNYFPTRFGSMVSGIDSIRNIEDFSAIKERTTAMRNGLIATDVFQALDNYNRQASKYAAFAEPISNIRKTAAALQKNETYNLDPEGNQAIVSYMEDMITSVTNHGVFINSSDKMFANKINKFMNNFSLAVLGMNPWVMFKQSSSLFSAASELGMSNIASNSKGRQAYTRILKGLKNVKLKDIQAGKLDLNDPTIIELMDLDPMFRKRFEGEIDREQGDYKSQSVNNLTGKDTGQKVFGKKLPLGNSMNGIKVFDAATIAWIYEAVKEEISKTIPDTESKAFKDAVRKRMTEVVNRTQPTYGVATRTGLGRSTNPILRLFTMFSSQRAKNMNILLESMFDYIHNPDERSIKKLKTAMATVGVMSSLSIAAIDMLKYSLMGYDDDDDSTILGELGTRTAMTTIGNFYFVGQAAQMIEAHATNKPFGKTIEHPMFQTVGYGAAAVAHLGKGELIKSFDNVARATMLGTGIPYTPYSMTRKGVMNYFEDPKAKDYLTSDEKKTWKEIQEEKKLRREEKKGAMSYEQKEERAKQQAEKMRKQISKYN